MQFEEVTIEQAIEIFKYHNPIDDLDVKTFLNLDFQESVEFGLKKFYENFNIFRNNF